MVVGNHGRAALESHPPWRQAKVNLGPFGLIVGSCLKGGMRDSLQGVLSRLSSALL